MEYLLTVIIFLDFDKNTSTFIHSDRLANKEEADSLGNHILNKYKIYGDRVSINISVRKVESLYTGNRIL